VNDDQSAQRDKSLDGSRAKPLVYHYAHNGIDVASFTPELSRSYMYLRVQQRMRYLLKEV